MDAKDALDVPYLREKMLAVLGEKADAYPHQIEQHFPRILAKLVDLWGKPAAGAYLDGLMFADDRANRQGFPSGVASELLRLSMIHDTLQSQKKPASQGGWSDDALGTDVEGLFTRRAER